MKKIKLKDINGRNVKIKIVDDEKKANFITHSGTFHADEIMASVILLNKFGDMNIYRTNKVTNEKAFVYDVGFGKFDHHAIDFDLTRNNGIKYATGRYICFLDADDLWDKDKIERQVDFMKRKHCWLMMFL